MRDSGATLAIFLDEGVDFFILLIKSCTQKQNSIFLHVQTFIEVKQHPQAGPETPHTMCGKFEDFLKNSIFDYFLTFCHGGPPHGLITDLVTRALKIKH